MNRRSVALGAALALSLSVSSALATSASAAAPATQDVTASETSTTDAAQALSQLRQDANGPVKVARDADGTVTSLSSTDGSAMLDNDASTPAGAVKETLADYGDAIGIDGDGSKAVVTTTVDSSTGGSVVRAQQTVDGLPVFGGQVVMSLDPDNDVTSITAATTDPDAEAPPVAVDEATARATAVAATARQQHVPADELAAADVGRRLYDPSVIGADTRWGARPVWQFTVTHGLDVRETVLVGSTKGEVVLAFNDAPGINRKICDNANQHTVPDTADVPTTCTAARAEGGSASGITDVNAAYANLGEASQAYSDLDNLDLTSMIGFGSGGSKALLSTVRWCYKNDPCPFDNAFWDGSQMVFGAGYATADDVVGHELTHGYVERTSNLFPIYQSGAINESVADTIGEIVDHRNGSDDDSAWTLGESLPGGALRSMKNPTLRFQGEPSQPDRMTSGYFQKAEAGDDLNGDNDDDGAVHRNDGVGNKTAYLISQGTAALPGGAFNGQTITGIDGSDAGLAKTGRLYLETIPRLTSGADYAQLGRVLVSTCDDLATNGTGGFTSGDCTSVRQAVAATELAHAPATAGAAAPKVAVSCQTTTPTVSMTDDDSTQDFGLTLGGFWARTPGVAASDGDAVPTPSYSASKESSVGGGSSLFAWDPGSAKNSSVVSDAFTVPAGVSSYFNFQQARQLIYQGSQFPTGGRVFVQKLVGSTWTTVNVPWVNGPAQNLLGTTIKVFGGDSHGYGSSQMDLSSLAGQTARVVFRIDAVADTDFSGGWWVDDLQLYSCPPLPSAPSSLSVAAGTGAATIAWGTPTVFPGVIDHYLVTRTGGAATSVAPTTHRLALRGFSGTSAVSVAVAAVAADGGRGLAVSRVINPTATSLASSKAKVKKKKPFVLTARVLRRGSSAAAPGVAVLLQRKAGSSWVNISSGTTGRSGTKAWTVKQSKSTYYRVLTKPGGLWFGSASAPKLVKKK